MKTVQDKNLIPGLAAVTLAVALMNTLGCAIGNIQLSGSGGDGPTSGVKLSGGVHGGQEPVTGATLQLYAAGAPEMPTSGGSTGGYGQGAIALIPAGSMSVGSTNNYSPGGASGCAFVTGNTNNCTALPQSDVNGNFTIGGDYTCPSTTSQVYIVATGGNPGAGGVVNNQFLALMAGLGTCPANGNLAATVPAINVDEVTTVATVWALQQFMTTPTGIAASAYASQGGGTAGVGVNFGAPSGPAGGYGSSGVQTAVFGMQNAFLMINNLTNIATGSSGTGTLGTAGNIWATPWADKINTIADVLAACINTDPSGSTSCSTLMTNATPSGSPKAADTIQAAWYMAQNPTNNVATLFGQISTTPPFLALSTAPNDWAIFVGLAPQFSAGGNAISMPYSGAFDEYGHLWVTNLSPTASATPFVSELAGDGSVLAGPFGNVANAAGMGAAFATANPYIANGGFVNASCSTTATHTLATSSSGGPKGILVDLANTVWVTNADETACASSTRSLLRLTGSTGYSPSTGGWTPPVITTGYFVNGSAYGGMGADGSNNVFVATSGSTGKTNEYVNGGGTYTAGATNAGSSPSAVVIDTNANGSGPNVWTVGQKDCGSLGQIYQQLLSGIGTATAGSTFTYQNASCTGAGTAGTVVNIGATLNTPLGAAVDRNNNVWVANSGVTTVDFLAAGATGSLDTTAATSASSTAGLGGMASPSGIAVDGNNYAWATTSAATGTTQLYYIGQLAATLGNPIAIGLAPPLLGSGSAGTGYSYPVASNPFPKTAKSMAIDPSGNVWLFSSSGTVSVTTPYNWASVIVGQAAPVITPLALEVKANMIGQKP